MQLRCPTQPLTWLRFVVVFAALLAGTRSDANDEAATTETAWTTVRGPNYDGHSVETGLTDEWPTEGPPVLWSRELGQGYSAFVAAHGRVFTQAQSMAGQFVYCLDAASGETIWRYRYDWAYESAGVYPGPRSTPTLDGDRLYFVSPDGLLGCLQQRDGKELWTVDLDERYGIEGVGFGYACSPTVIDGKVLMPVGAAGSGMVALDAESGREIWASGNDAASYTPALPIELAGQPLAVGYLQNALVIHDRNTGQEVRRLELSKGYDEHSAWPVYQEPFLWIAAPFRAGSRLLDLSSQPATTVWQHQHLSNDVCSSVYVDGYLYGFDIVDVQSKTHRPSRGTFRCIKFATGETCWANGSTNPWRSLSETERMTRIGQAGIIAADNKLIVLNELGELILLATDHEQCRELARCSILSGELTWTAPCLYKSCIYARNQSKAVCVYLGDPAELNHTGTLLHTSDLSQHEWFDLAGFLLAVEPEYAFDVPSDRWLWQWLAACMVILVMSCMAGWLMQRSTFDGRFGTVPALIAFVLGAFGTTTLGHATGAFIFTWPVCLYATFAWVNDRPTNSTGTSWNTSLRRRIPVTVLLVVCAAYFLICRRLSLVFEWAFLTGFAGAFPLFAIMRLLDRPSASELTVSYRRLLIRMVAILAGLVLFFAASTAFLKWRY